MGMKFVSPTGNMTAEGDALDIWYSQANLRGRRPLRHWREELLLCQRRHREGHRMSSLVGRRLA